MDNRQDLQQQLSSIVEALTQQGVQPQLPPAVLDFLSQRGAAPAPQAALPVPQPQVQSLIQSQVAGASYSARPGTQVGRRPTFPSQAQAQTQTQLQQQQAQPRQYVSYASLNPVAPPAAALPAPLPQQSQQQQQFQQPRQPQQQAQQNFDNIRTTCDSNLEQDAPDVYEELAAREGVSFDRNRGLRTDTLVAYLTEQQVPVPQRVRNQSDFYYRAELCSAVTNHVEDLRIRQAMALNDYDLMRSGRGYSQQQQQQQPAVLRAPLPQTYQMPAPAPVPLPVPIPVPTPVVASPQRPVQEQQQQPLYYVEETRIFQQQPPPPQQHQQQEAEQEYPVIAPELTDDQVAQLVGLVGQQGGLGRVPPSLLVPVSRVAAEREIYGIPQDAGTSQVIYRIAELRGIPVPLQSQQPAQQEQRGQVRVRSRTPPGARVSPTSSRPVQRVRLDAGPDASQTRVVPLAAQPQPSAVESQMAAMMQMMEEMRRENAMLRTQVASASQQAPQVATLAVPVPMQQPQSQQQYQSQQPPSFANSSAYMPPLAGATAPVESVVRYSQVQTDRYDDGSLVVTETQTTTGPADEVPGLPVPQSRYGEGQPEEDPLL
ncbi:hypothetical protein ml_378 [Mollivirus sibericum]|uniref:hypothetical protein n=1 Tax=Mollivirus sibericum TaxID=1678078 RepID=UPI0006B2E8A7|nr:hypothetical protein ml_378 [Mollivirus sibericum]ALD62180.1 hypothetical protein ml_378 [Mollivirus sibericum]